MKKISQKIVKLTDFNRNSIQLSVTISSITQFADPLFINNDGKKITGSKRSDKEFSFVIPKNDFENRLLFTTSFNVDMTEENLQILINTCKIKFEFPQEAAKDFSFNPFAGKNAEDLKGKSIYPVYKFIKV